MTSRDLEVLSKALDHLARGFDDLPASEPTAFDDARFEAVMMHVAHRLRDNFPYGHPLYAGQMLKPPHPIARTAYALAQWVNPNNHALDGGRASSAMEKECVVGLGRMVGWAESLGHLTGGGTMANLEALWVASRIAPGRTVLASKDAHYTHPRLCEVLGIPFEAIAVDAKGAMDVGALEARLGRGDVGLVVATAGTTGLGAVDPIHEIAALSDGRFRLHVDAAYGGYFRLARNLHADTTQAMEALALADSIVIDPHKHGLQPYGCGAILFRDPSVGRFYHHDSPYTYFSSAELHLGEISLECSRPGAAAVALWATMELLGLEPGGALALGLESGHRAALHLAERLTPAYRVPVAPELDIVVFAPTAASLSEMGDRSRAIFDRAAQAHLHLAMFQVSADRAITWWPEVEADAPMVTVLRSCLMKPEHEAWVDRIADVLLDVV